LIKEKTENLFNIFYRNFQKLLAHKLRGTGLC
jgi:hypothetical protein